MPVTNRAFKSAAAMRISEAAVALAIALASVSLVMANPLYIKSDDEKGRDVWLENCEGCHGYGIADAPIPMSPDEWDFRLVKGIDVLYLHAIDGFIGPDYSMMPARGGNEELDDEEIKRAVDYMVYLAKFYINKLETEKR